jgi:phosphoadenosine phosphosulfate reductase
MGIVRLGALLLRWCDVCNLPVLRQKTCGTCGGRTREVKVTPPGDIRPAFDHDIKQIRELVSRQFGDSAGNSFIPDNHIVLLNRAPGLDTIDEIIINGAVIGSLYFDISKLEFKIIMRQASADLIKDRLDRGFVRVDKGAESAIASGASVLIPGITEISEGIEKGGEVIILNSANNVIATGNAKMSTAEMREQSRGSAIKPRWYGDYKSFEPEESSKNWEDVIKANSVELQHMEKKATDFINKVITENELPFVVSFSGGKDSLATLLLVLESGNKPELLFVNTDLELPETVKYTQDMAEHYGLTLNVEQASSSFWENLEFFGPPGKDFRWCCKTNKLGPASKLIKSKYPDGVLSFIGQRSYESEPRSKKGPVWNNPWVPGQSAASPIQKWTALHVWLYIFLKKAPVNPWYEKGLDRIGCFMCPASNLSELEAISKGYPDYDKWSSALKGYADKHGYSDKWSEFGLWRWHKHPKELLAVLGNPEIQKKMTETIESTKPKIELDENSEVYSIGPYHFISLGGFEDCKGALSLEGVFDFDIDFENTVKLLNIIGEAKLDDIGSSCNVGTKITLFKNGTLSITGPDKKRLIKTLRNIQSIIIRNKNCVECGICVARCPNDALSNENGIRIDIPLCTHCRQCLGPCAVVDFERGAEIEF